MKWIVTLSIPILLAQFALSETAAANCTIGVACGAVTHDGRSILWKSRMTGRKPDHEVMFFFGVPYRYIGVRGGSAYYPQMGVNSAGLCTGNSQVGPDGSGDGPFTEHVLRNFATVDEVRDYIQQELAAGMLNVSGCFPIADAAGNAVIFEINRSNWVLEYDAMNPNRADQGLLGWIVRANEFHDMPDGTDDTSIGGRYLSGVYNIDGLIEIDLLSARTVMQGNDGLHGYEFMRYGPGRPLDTLAAATVGSSMVVHGVLPDEDPALVTMWILLGHSDYGIAVPMWVRVTNIPDQLTSGELAALANSLYDEQSEAATQASTLPLEAFLFDETEALLAHWRSAGVPSVEEMTRVETRMADDAYSVLYCLDFNDHDNRAPACALSLAETSGLSFHFEVAATDEDGSVTRIFWDFGDNRISWAESPWHTYDAPGWYLVSCTAMDDDGANITDWQHIRVPKGNRDGDGDIDVDDYAGIPGCLTGPGTQSPAPECEIFDVEGDDDIDLADLAGFQSVFTGPVSRGAGG
jgi:hypothetical protein